MRFDHELRRRLWRCHHDGLRAGGDSAQLLFDPSKPSLHLRGSRQCRGRDPTPDHRQPRIIAPPVQADLLGLVDRANEKPDLNGQQLHIRQVDLDIAGDDEALVQHAVEDVDQAVRPRRIYELRHRGTVSGCKSLVAGDWLLSAGNGQWRATSNQGLSQPSQRSQIDIQIFVRQTEDRFQLVHPMVELEEG